MATVPTTTSPTIIDTIIKDAQSLETLVLALIAQFAPQFSSIAQEIVTILNAIANATGNNTTTQPTP